MTLTLGRFTAASVPFKNARSTTPATKYENERIVNRQHSVGSVDVTVTAFFGLGGSVKFEMGDIAQLQAWELRRRCGATS